MSAFSSTPFFKPGAVAAFAVTWVSLFVPLLVVSRKEREKTNRKPNALCHWLFFHAFEVILVDVSVIFAVWFMEHGRSLAWAAANCFVMPTVWIAGTMISARLRNVLRSRSVNRSK